MELDTVRLRLFIILDRCALSISTLAWQADTVVGKKDWQHDGIFSLLPEFCWSICNTRCPDGFMLLRGIPQGWKYPEKKPNAPYLTVEAKTLVVEQLCVLKFEANHKYLYASFPPPLSRPTI